MTNAETLLRTWAADPTHNLGPILADAVEEDYPNCPPELLHRLRTEDLSRFVSAASFLRPAGITPYDLYAAAVYLGNGLGKYGIPPEAYTLPDPLTEMRARLRRAEESLADIRRYAPQSWDAPESSHELALRDYIAALRREIVDHQRDRVRSWTGVG